MNAKRLSAEFLGSAFLLIGVWALRIIGDFLGRVLTKGGVFSDDFIDAYIHLKSEEEIKVRTFVHPLEYDLYYSV